MNFDPFSPHIILLSNKGFKLAKNQGKKIKMMGEEESNPLLVSNEEITSTTHEVRREPTNVGAFVEEGKKQLGLAAPLVAANILQYCLQVISVMFVGHLGELPLSSASMATSFAAVTGYSVLVRVLCLSFGKF